MKKQRIGIIFLISGFVLTFQRTLMVLLGINSSSSMMIEISGILTVIGALAELIGIVYLIIGFKEIKK